MTKESRWCRNWVGCSSFTLIEVMVALTIVAILFALLMGAYQSSMEGARRIECLSNMRQLGLAFHLYSLDHDERFPFPNASAYRESQAHHDLCWFNALDNNLCSATTIATSKEEERLLFIKQDPIFKKFIPNWQTNAHTIKMNEWLGDYNCNGEDTESYFWSIRDFAEPARTVLLFDGRAEGEEPMDDEKPPVSAILRSPEGTEGDVARRHNGGANVLFVDGHVQYRREKQQASNTKKGWEKDKTTLIWKPYPHEEED